jgi:hypothetical protein
MEIPTVTIIGDLYLSETAFTPPLDVNPPMQGNYRRL